MPGTYITAQQDSIIGDYKRDLTNAEHKKGESEARLATVKDQLKKNQDKLKETETAQAMLKNVQAAVHDFSTKAAQALSPFTSLFDDSKNMKALAEEFSAVQSEVQQFHDTAIASATVTAKDFAKTFLPLVELIISKPYFEGYFKIERSLLSSTVRTIAESE
jgi:ABC-type transporter Mla subunit MlaD